MKKNNELLNIRNEINTIDLNILFLLSQRRCLSLKVINNKILFKIPIRDKIRENSLLLNLINKGKKLNLDSSYITELYNIIVQDSVLIQQNVLKSCENNITRIAFLGPIGSYSHLAVQQYKTNYLNNNKVIEYVCEKFIEIFKLVELEQVEYGILPIYNNSTGPINEIYDLLQDTKLVLIGEITTLINHCLLTKNSFCLNNIKTLYSHPQPIQQCSKFLSNFPKWKIRFCNSSSAAMKIVSDLDDLESAALGNKQSGILYNLKVLKNNISNHNKNATSFVILAKNSIKINKEMLLKIILLINIQKFSIIKDILLVFHHSNVDIINMEFRPLLSNDDNKCNKTLFIDLKANIDNIKIQKIINELKKYVDSLKILGCYPYDNQN